jgi:tetratricopeptide (TPR) repeat protein
MAAQQPADELEEMHQQVTRLFNWERHEEARALALEACEVARRLRGEDHPDTARCFARLAALLKMLGDPQAALPHLDRAAQTYRRALGEAHPQAASALVELGCLCWQVGDPRPARRHLEQAVQIARRAGDDALTATSLKLLGRLLWQTEDAAAARPCLEEAVKIRRDQGAAGSEMAAGLNDLAALLLELGDLDAARPCLDEAVQIGRREAGGHPVTVASLDHLGRLAHRRGDLTEARAYFAHALDAQRRGLAAAAEQMEASQRLTLLGVGLLGPLVAAAALWVTEGAESYQQLSYPDVATDLRGLGQGFLHRGDLKAARDCLEEALEFHREWLGGEHPCTAASLVALGALEAAAGRVGEAAEVIHQGAAIYNRTLQDLFFVSSRQERSFLLGHFLGAEAAYLSLIGRHLSGSPEAVRRAFDLLLRREAFAADALAPGRADRLPERHPRWRRELDQLDQLRRQLARQRLDPEDDAAARLVPGRRRECDQREADLAGRIPEVRLARQRRQADHRAVAQAVPRGVALVEFVRCDAGPGARYLAFVLSAGRVGLIDLGEADSIDRLIGELLLEVATPPEQRPRGGPAEIGSELRRRVFDPLLAAVDGLGEWWLCPDGELVRLPFEVLPAREEGKRLLDVYRISYLAGGADVTTFAARQRGLAAGLLAEVGRLFGGGSRPREPAPAVVAADADARTEGERVAVLLGVDPLLDESVLERRLLAVRSPRILHLATPVLSAEDVAGMDLIDTEQVVLSAGEAGASDLRRAFAVAGAKAAVLSLWKAPDGQTQELLLDFYQRLLRGEGRSEALRQAQQTIRAGEGGKFADPFYWGAFICQGDPGPIRC